jgi:hypothetical protein
MIQKEAAMWTGLFPGFFEYSAWSALVWFTLIGILGYVFARERFRTFINGLGRLVASAVTAPIVFLRRAVGTVSAYARPREEEHRSTDQYLLNKLLLGLHAGVILVALGSFAAGLVTTWNVLLPDKHLRDAIRETRQKIHASEEELVGIVGRFTELDTAWEKDRLSSRRCCFRAVF